MIRKLHIAALYALVLGLGYVVLSGTTFSVIAFYEKSYQRGPDGRLPTAWDKYGK